MSGVCTQLHGADLGSAVAWAVLLRSDAHGTCILMVAVTSVSSLHWSLCSALAAPVSQMLVLNSKHKKTPEGPGGPPLSNSFRPKTVHHAQTSSSHVLHQAVLLCIFYIVC